jgi:hypothetical protein
LDVATGGLFTLNHHDVRHLHRAAVAGSSTIQAAAQLKEAKKLEAAAKKQKQGCRQGRKKRLDTYWKEVASNGWKNQLQDVMKSNAPPPPGAYEGKYYGSILAVYITIRGCGGSSSCKKELPKLDLFNSACRL